jgi:hypothetical protein
VYVFTSECFFFFLSVLRAGWRTYGGARAAVLEGWCGWQPQEELINSVVKKAALLSSKRFNLKKKIKNNAFSFFDKSIKN